MTKLSNCCNCFTIDGGLICGKCRTACSTHERTAPFTMVSRLPDSIKNPRGLSHDGGGDEDSIAPKQEPEKHLEKGERKKEFKKSVQALLELHNIKDSYLANLITNNYEYYSPSDPVEEKLIDEEINYPLGRSMEFITLDTAHRQYLESEAKRLSASVDHKDEQVSLRRRTDKSRKSVPPQDTWDEISEILKVVGFTNCDKVHGNITSCNRDLFELKRDLLDLLHKEREEAREKVIKQIPYLTLNYEYFDGKKTEPLVRISEIVTALKEEK